MDSSGVMRRIGRWSRLVVCLLATGIVSLSGCGSDKVKPIVGPIAFTDISGQQLQGPVVSLNVNQGAYMMVNLTNDSAMLGADWSVSCASALPPGTPLPPGQVQDLSCGTFTPEHSMSGPIVQGATSGAGYVVFYTAPAAIPKGNTVTLYASATSDHTRFSTVTLNIIDLPQ